jgi:hypothetical protein
MGKQDAWEVCYTAEEDRLRLYVERGYLRTETESELTAAQDEASQTKYYLKELLRTVTDCK